MCRFVLSTTGRCGKVVTLCFRMADMFAKLPCGSQRRAPSRIRWTREKLAVKPRSRWEGGKNALSILEKSTGTIHVQGQRGPPVLWLDSRPTSPLLASAACCSSAIVKVGARGGASASCCAPSCTSWERKAGRSAAAPWLSWRTSHTLCVMRPPGPHRSRLSPCPALCGPCNLGTDQRETGSTA